MIEGSKFQVYRKVIDFSANDIVMLEIASIPTLPPGLRFASD